MDETERLIRRSMRLARVACLLSLGALLASALQFYSSWINNRPVAATPPLPLVENTTAAPPTPAEEPEDARSDLSLQELVRRSPNIRSGNLQGWWAGEQARKVLRLEAESKRQLLTGDREGAARTLARADAIRAQIPTLASSEKPASR